MSVIRLVRRGAEGTVRRRPGDAARAVIAAAVVTLLALHSGHPIAAERDVRDFFDSLPNDAQTALRVVYDLVALWAVALLAVAVVLVRRWRLARDLVLAGAGAWFAARVVAFVVSRTDFTGAVSATFDLDDSPRFPLVRIAVAVALITVAAPHLSRPTRRVGVALVTLLALTSLYIQHPAPVDVLAAAVLGWGIAAAIHLAVGTPNRRPLPSEVQSALKQIGLNVTGLRAAPEQPVGRAVFLATDDGGPIRITALGRDEADAQFLNRAGRFIAFRNSPPVLYPTRRQQVDHEASIESAARAAGVRSPEVVSAGTAGPLALLVERMPAATMLFDHAARNVSDAVLDDAWRQVVKLHVARIVHGLLDGRHLALDGTHAYLTGFEYASDLEDSDQGQADVAELLAATAAVVGNERAVAAALRVVGPDELAAALPRLQAPALSGWTHDAFGGRATLDAKLESLRAAGARAAGIEPPQLRPIYRVHPNSILLAVAALLGGAALLSQIGDPAVFWRTIQDAQWGWVGLACVLGLATDATFGVTFLGNVPTRLPVWPSIELQSAMSFSNLAVPVAADAALQVRFLQRFGLDLSSAVAAGGLLSAVTEMAVQVGLLVLALWLAPDSIHFGRVNTSEIVKVLIGAIVGLGIGSAVLLGFPKLRAAVVPPVKRAGRTVWSAIKTPARMAVLLGGNVVAQCLYAASLLVCLLAFGTSVNFWTLLAMNIGVSLIASLVPIPGGGTAVSIVGTASMLAAVGVPEAAASAAVLAQQVAVAYLPAIPGWFAMRDLLRKGLL